MQELITLALFEKFLIVEGLGQREVIGKIYTYKSALELEIEARENYFYKFYNEIPDPTNECFRQLDN